MAAVLQGPSALRPTQRPLNGVEVSRRRCRHRLLRQLLSVVVDRDERVGPLCESLPSVTMVLSPLSRGIAQDRSVDTPELGRDHAPIKSRRPFRRVRQAANPLQATTPRPGSTYLSQTRRTAES